MSDQLEPELERVARMLADAGPLPDAPATLRERALAIPDGGPAADGRRRPRRRAAPPAAQAAPDRARSASRPSSRRSRSCRRSLVTRGGDGGQRIDLAARSFAPQGGGTAHVVAHGDGSATIELTVWKMPRPGAGASTRPGSGARATAGRSGCSASDPTGKATVSFKRAARRAGRLPLALGDERARRQAAGRRATRRRSGDPLT